MEGRVQQSDVADGIELEGLRSGKRRPRGALLHENKKDDSRPVAISSPIAWMQSPTPWTRLAPERWQHARLPSFHEPYPAPRWGIVF